jgi:hypothetical protein
MRAKIRGTDWKAECALKDAMARKRALQEAKDARDSKGKNRPITRWCYHDASDIECGIHIHL